MTRWFNRCFYYSVGVLPLVLLVSSCTATHLHSTPPVRHYQSAYIPSQSGSSPDEHSLTVMTLNIAHGRGTSFHQMLQYSDATKKNLDAISTLLNQVGPDVVAFQEIDGPSFWSGNFNHLGYLASRSLFANSVQAAHVEGMGLSYGTALMSRLELSDPKAVTFAPSLSTVPKGFVVSTISWPGQEGIGIDVISCHLDFMSRSARKRQAEELIALLRARKNRVIIMGDLNSGWHEHESVAQYLVEQLGLAAYQPENRGIVTFPALGERLDWILISPGLEFSSHEVIGTPVSDHRGIVAKLTLSGADPTSTAPR